MIKKWATFNENLSKKEIDDILNIGRDEGLSIYVSSLSKHLSSKPDSAEQILISRYLNRTATACSNVKFVELVKNIYQRTK